MNDSPNDRHRVDDLTLAHTSSRALARARRLALAHTRSRARDIDHELELTRELSRDIDHELTRELTRDIDHARALNLELAHAHKLDLELTRELDVVLGHAIEKAEWLCHALGQPAPEDAMASSAVPARKQVEPRRAARRVADLAVRVLPVAHRARYRDEYRSELHDIAATGASWWQQVAYAVRLLDRSWELRRELRRPTARRARS